MSDQQDAVKEDGIEVWLSENASQVMLWVLATALVIIVGIAVAYFALFLSPPLSIDPGTLGQAGDYFGGLLNPALSFLSVFALLVALVIQTRELKLSREALKVSQEEQAKASAALDAQNQAIQNQSFEQTFFSWLRQYSELLASIEVLVTGNYVTAEPDREYKGRRGLQRIWTKRLSPRAIWIDLKETLERPWPDGSGTQITPTSLAALPRGCWGQVSVRTMEEWEEMYGDWEYQLDCLFRTLFSLLQWVDAQAPNRLTLAQKWLYVSIVRAQLSRIEMVFLFYNGLTPRGQKFKALIEKYALFDNLTIHTDPVLRIVKECPPNAGQGYEQGAFDSAIARGNLGLPSTSQEVLALATGM